MTKPGRQEHEPSQEISTFTDRGDQRKLFQFWVNSAEEPSLLMFYGMPGVSTSVLRALVPDPVYAALKNCLALALYARPST